MEKLLRFSMLKRDGPNSWVFSSVWGDSLVFLVPLLIAYGVSKNYNGSESILKFNLGAYLLFSVFLNLGHVFGTTFPLALDKRLIEKVGYNKVFYFPLLFLTIFFLLNLISPPTFKSVLGYYGLYHIYTQQYAWLAFLQRSEKKLSLTQKKIEKILFISIVAVPNLLWFAGQTPNSPTFLFADNLRLPINLFDLHFLIWPTIIGFLGYISFIVGQSIHKTCPMQWGKLMLFVCTFIWIFGGLVFFNSRNFFVLYLVMTHSLGYLLFISRGWTSGGKWEKIFQGRKIAKLCIFVFALAFMWSKFTGMLTRHYGSELLFLVWLPVLIHYSYDAILWRNSSSTVFPSE